MPEQLLTILKVCLLALLYLFFARVLRAVWVEVNGPRGKRARRRLAAEQEAARARAVAQAAPGLVAPAARPVAAARQTAVADEPAAQATQRRRGARRKVAANAGGAPSGPGLVTVAPAELAGRRWDLTDELTLGRAAGCSITLDDTYASQMHCRVFVSNGGVYVEDLGSTNGTYLNRDKVSGPMLLSPGDQVQIGSTVMELT